MTAIPVSIRSLEPGSHRARLKTIRTTLDLVRGYHTDLVFEIQSPPCEGVVVSYPCPGIPNRDRSVLRQIGRLSSGLLPTDGPDAESAFLEVDYQLTVLPDRETGRLQIVGIYMFWEG